MSEARAPSPAYYNEFDPYAAQWLRNLIAAGHLPAGDVDERSIVDVQPDDLKGYAQCHFFAGIGGWPLALRMAGWPDDRPVWTASCPCQPISVAGKRKGHADERHLWPAFFRFVPERQPPTIFGEQVASKDGREWFAGIRADLEDAGYACGGADLCAAGIGAPHIRQRLFWVANANKGQRGRFADGEGCLADRAATGRFKGHRELEPHSDASRVADTDGRNESDRDLQRSWQHGFWTQDTIAICCTDGRTRRIPAQPEFQPLAHGVSARVGKLRAYGNAIVPALAAEFIAACQP